MFVGPPPKSPERKLCQEESLDEHVAFGNEESIRETFQMRPLHGGKRLPKKGTKRLPSHGGKHLPSYGYKYTPPQALEHLSKPSPATSNDGLLNIDGGAPVSVSGSDGEPSDSHRNSEYHDDGGVDDNSKTADVEDDHNGPGDKVIDSVNRGDVGDFGFEAAFSEGNNNSEAKSDKWTGFSPPPQEGNDGASITTSPRVNKNNRPESRRDCEVASESHVKRERVKSFLLETTRGRPHVLSSAALEIPPIFSVAWLFW